MQFAEISGGYPGASTWYNERSRQWHAALPSSQNADDIVTAPSPAALARMLAARYTAVRSGIA
jgi:hypothetical protein